jgi:nucleotide-binding universal stress UspA family protein
MAGIDRLIVGTSGSPGSLHALRYAEALARAHNAALIPVMAWAVPGGDQAGRMRSGGDMRQACRQLASEQLRNALIAVWGEVPSDRLVQPQVELGSPGWVLVNLACRPGDLLIVGAGRRGTVARMAFSKVSRYCLAHAQCPVLAVPPPALAAELRHRRLVWLFWHRALTPEQILRDAPKPVG